jgi:hypothetical protein
MPRLAAHVMEMLDELLAGGTPESVRLPMHLELTGSIGPPPGTRDGGGWEEP